MAEKPTKNIPTAPKPEGNQGDLVGNAGDNAAGDLETAEKEQKEPSLKILIELDLEVKLKVELDLKVHGKVNIGLL